MKTPLAVAAGKAVFGLIQMLDMGTGTSLPGKIARKVDPDLLAHLGSQIRSHRIAVTGTNGKTTTCGLLAQFLRESGERVIHNQLGANMVPGITAALLQQSSMCGKLDADIGVFEVDEASLKGLTSELPIDHVLVTNLFRDQLDRYGELDTTARLILEGIEKSGIAQGEGRLILNADDPLVAGLGRAFPAPSVLYYGVEHVDYGESMDLQSPVPFTREVTLCPQCGKSLQYKNFTLGHLGHYDCAACGYRRPKPVVCAEAVWVTPAGSTVKIRYGETAFEFQLPLPGLFNVYNALAALAVLADLNLLSADLVSNGVGHYQSVFGRAERRTVDGKSVLVLLIKNPVGASEVLKLVGSDPKGRLMIALNDNYADGRDVSWIWDAQFDYLLKHYASKPVMVSGKRAFDMANRLKYAGLPEDHLQIEPDLRTAFQKALSQTPADETLYVLPTYTALLEFRNF